MDQVSSAVQRVQEMRQAGGFSGPPVNNATQLQYQNLGGAPPIMKDASFPGSGQKPADGYAGNARGPLGTPNPTYQNPQSGMGQNPAPTNQEYRPAVQPQYTGSYDPAWVSQYNQQSSETQAAMRDRFSGKSPGQITQDWNQNIQPRYAPGTSQGDILGGAAPASAPGMGYTAPSRSNVPQSSMGHSPSRGYIDNPAYPGGSSGGGGGGGMGSYQPASARPAPGAAQYGTPANQQGGRGTVSGVMAPPTQTPNYAGQMVPGTNERYAANDSNDPYYNEAYAPTPDKRYIPAKLSYRGAGGAGSYQTKSQSIKNPTYKNPAYTWDK